MAKNSVTKRFLDGDIWTCPAGVTSVVVAANTFPVIDTSLFNSSRTVGDVLLSPLAKSTSPIFNYGSTQLGPYLIDNQNRLYTWGQSSQMQGWGDLVARSVPTLVAGNVPTKAYYVSSGGQTSALVSMSGQMYTWGTTFGIAGGGDSVSRSSPLLMAGTASLIWRSAVFALGFSDSFGLTSNGQFYGWGGNAFGGIGDGTVTARLSPTLAIGGYSFRVAGGTVSTSNSSSFGISYTNQLYMWGANTNGGLGVGDVTSRSSPTLVVGNIAWKYVNNNYFQTTVGLSTTGQLYMWGICYAVQAGDGLTRSSPTLIASASSIIFKNVNIGINQNSSSNGASSGLSTSGGLYVWGVNTNGNLGTNDVVNKSSPVLILSSVRDYLVDSSASASNTSYAVTISGQLYAWGSNVNGNLGDGTTIKRSSPVLIASNVKSYTLGNDASFSVSWFINSSGQLYTWGNNSTGILGDGTTVNRSSPVLVLGGYTWKTVTIQAGGASYGITTSNQMYMWGLNTSGEMGDGTLISKSSPVLVLGGILWAQKALYGGVSLTGQCYSWGLNVNGNLGVGDLLNRSSPVLLLGGIPASVQQMTTTSQVLQVTPGVSYKVDCNFGIPMFGNFSIGSQPADFVTVSYNN